MVDMPKTKPKIYASLFQVYKIPVFFDISEVEEKNMDKTKMEFYLFIFFFLIVKKENT